MPVRKVSGHGGNIIGHVPSLKAKRMVAYESTVERDCIYLLDYDPAVVHFEEQPFKIPFQWENRAHTYTPDFHVSRHDGQWVVECKPVKFMDSPANRVKFQAAAQWCRGQGKVFEVVTEQMLRSGFRLGNVTRLAQFSRHVVPDSLRYSLLAILGDNQMSIRDLAERTVPRASHTVLHAIYHLAYHHVIEFDIDREPLNVATILWAGRP